MTVHLPRDCSTRYVPERRLGEGGFGVVWRARDTSLDRAVAIKLLHPEQVATDEGKHRFEQEARVTSRLSHPAIVKVLDFGFADAVPWIVYELIEGATLREVLAAGPLAPPEAIAAAWQIAGALSVAHRAGLIHRDVKPDNIFRVSETSYKLMDFGIAKYLDGRGYRTHTGVIVATPAYVAPEVITGERASAASDVYALGCTLFELLTGDIPFPGTIPETLDGHLKGTPPRASALVPGISAALDRVIVRAMAKQPGDRFASASEFGRALEALRTPAATTLVSPTSPRRRRSGGAVALALVALACVWQWGVPRPPPPPAVSADAPGPAKPVLVGPFVPVHELLVVPTEDDVLIDFFLVDEHRIRLRIVAEEGEFLSKPQKEIRGSHFHGRLPLRPDARHRLDVWIDDRIAVKSYPVVARDRRVMASQRAAIHAAKVKADGRQVVTSDILLCGNQEPDETYPPYLLTLLRAPGAARYQSLECTFAVAGRIREPEVGEATAMVLGELFSEPGKIKAWGLGVQAVALSRVPDIGRHVDAWRARSVGQRQRDQWLRYLSRAVFLARQPSSVDQLAAMIEERTSLRDGRITVWMIMLDPKRAREHFDVWLSSGDERVRWAAITGFAELGDAYAVRRLGDWLSSPEAEAESDAEAAWEALAAIHSAEARARLQALLAAATRPGSLSTALWSAVRAGVPGVVNRLERILDDPALPAARRAQAAFALGYLGGVSGREALERALAGTSALSVRQAAFFALGQQRAAGVLSLCAEMLARRDEEIRGVEAYLLGESGRGEYLDVVRTALENALTRRTPASEPWLPAFAVAHARLAGAAKTRELVATRGGRDARERLSGMLDVLEREPNAAACLVLPRGQFVRSGVHVEPGDVLTILTQGSFGPPAGAFKRPWDEYLGADGLYRLRLEARIGPQVASIGSSQEQLLVRCAGELVFTAFGQAYESEGYALVRAGRDQQPDVGGAAVVVVSRSGDRK